MNEKYVKIEELSDCNITVYVLKSIDIQKKIDANIHTIVYYKYIEIEENGAKDIYESFCNDELECIEESVTELIGSYIDSLESNLLYVEKNCRVIGKKSLEMQIYLDKIEYIED